MGRKWLGAALVALSIISVSIALSGCVPSSPSPSPTPPAPTPTPTSPPAPTPTPAPTPGVSELLQYRELDSFTTEAVKDVRRHADMRGYGLPDEIVEWPDFAVYVVVQNLDDVPGTFEVRYTLSTADKNAAERQQWLVQRTPEEYAELDREYYEGSIELYLESGEVGVAICPPGGIYIAPDRVPFSHELEIIPGRRR